MLIPPATASRALVFLLVFLVFVGRVDAEELLLINGGHKRVGTTMGAGGVHVHRIVLSPLGFVFWDSQRRVLPREAIVIYIERFQKRRLHSLGERKIGFALPLSIAVE